MHNIFVLTIHITVVILALILSVVLYFVFELFL